MFDGLSYNQPAGDSFATFLGNRLVAGFAKPKLGAFSGMHGLQ
jgi:hypothetical protein